MSKPETETNMSKRNTFLDHGSSDESGSEAGYDSEAVEVSKSARTKSIPTSQNAKRRKLSHPGLDRYEASLSEGTQEDEDGSDGGSNFDESFVTARDHLSPIKRTPVRPVVQKTAEPMILEDEEVDTVENDEEEGSDGEEQEEEADFVIESAAHNLSELEKGAQRQSSTALDDERKEKSTSGKRKKEATPGVVYLSSLPPYLKPSALKNLLVQRGFTPIVRLYLTRVSKHKKVSKKNSRQLYSEGWIEFASKKTARRCAETLNAQIVGGKKGGYYHDDLWNMKYLKGMSWDELMAGIREERREEEGRVDEERRKIAAETKAFIEGAEASKRQQTTQRKKKTKARKNEGGEDEVKQNWRQYEPAGANRRTITGTKDSTSAPQDVQDTLAGIF